MNKLNLNKNSTEANKSGINFNILNQDITNVDEHSFDLDMDSAEDEIDVGTHADSMLINYNSLQHLHSHSPFSINTNSTPSALAGVQNDHQFGLISNNQANSIEQSASNFAVPQHTAIMSEADRKRAHHNALERKRRDHIKDSFHTLRDAIPNIKGEKVSTSRAQILKAATDYIKTMKNRNTVYQNDIDLIKKQNMEIEAQIRQLEKSKLSTNQCLNTNVIIKTEQQSHSSTPNHMQINDNSDDNDFKFELSESGHPANLLPHSNNVLKANNVLILTKPSANSVIGQTTTSKKFKTIVTPKTSLINNNNNNNNTNGNFL